MSFVLIDRILTLSSSQVIASKLFDDSDPVFRDHFPGSALVPGSLILEGMAQSCGWWVSWKGKGLEKSVLLMAEGVQFRHWVRPGETIRYEGKVLQSGDGRARFSAQAISGGKIVARAELSFAVFALDDPKGPFQSEILAGWVEEIFKSLHGPAASEKNP